MGKSKKAASVSASKSSRNKSPRSLKYYLFSTKYHKLIGEFATESYFRVKSMFHKDISFPRQKNPDTPSAVKKVRQDIKSITKRSNEVLASATSVFPLTLFPDSVVLDRTKVTITQRNFFMSSKVLSFRIQDVLNVSADVGPFFGSLTIVSRVLSSEDHFTINHFYRGDAIHLKHMIQGYVIAQHNKIDVSYLEQEELIETLAELGHDLNS